MNQRTSSYLSSQLIFILDDRSHDILDVNEPALERYGYTYDEFCELNLSNLGKKTTPTELISDVNKNDPIWIHKSKEGEEFFVQFTYHKFNFRGQPAKFAVAHDVTEHIKQQEDHPNSYPRLETHKANFPLAEIGWGPDCGINYWSEQAEELLGWQEKEIKGEESFLKSILPKEAFLPWKNKFQKSTEKQHSQYTVESKVRTKEGKVRYCKWYNSLLYNEQGNLKSARSLIADITEESESQNLFRALSEESLVGIYLIQDGKFRYVNPRFADIFGYTKKEIEGHLSIDDLVHPDDREKVQQNITDRIQGNRQSVEYGFRGKTKDGHVAHVHVYGSAIEYAGAPAVVGTLVDTTHNKKIVKQYRSSLKSFKDLFDSISDAIYIQDKEGCFLEVNRGAEEMYGYKRDYFIGKSPEFLAAEGRVDLDHTQQLIEKALNGSPQSFKWWGKRKNGEVFPKEVVANPGKYFGEDVVIAIARDISERYEAEEQLRRSEEKFRQLFQNAPIGIAFMDKDQELRFVNESFTEVFGFTTEEIKGKNIDEVIVPEKAKSDAYEVSEKIYNGNTAQTSGRRRCKDGSFVDVLIYGVPVMVEEETIAIYGLYVDITENKKAEDKIKKSLKEKEVLLAEIHHRVKNNLAVITGLLELQTYNTSSDEAVKVLKESQMRINSIALIHEKLYQRDDLSQISFDIYVEQLLKVVVSSLHIDQTNVDVHIDAKPVDLTVNQAIPCGLIMNELITNAYKHAFAGRATGNIWISVIEEEGEVILSVEDDGVGMPEETSIENPTSLGIQLIDTLSEQLQGQVSFSDRNPGTHFKMQFNLEE